MAEIERGKSEESKRWEEIEKALEEEKQKHAAVPLSLSLSLSLVASRMFSLIFSDRGSTKDGRTEARMCCYVHTD
jgi:hypothetical protein